MSKRKNSRRTKTTNVRRRAGLSRRAFLGGAGAIVGLPVLESLGHVAGLAGQVAHAAEPGAPPVRLLYYYVPNGMHMPAWTPTATGLGYDLPTILQPLAPVQGYVSVISGLENYPANPDGPGDHASGTGAFITCAHPYKTDGADIQNGISADQVAAASIGTDTPFPSLQLGTDGGASVGGCDSGYSCAYARNISWAGPKTPLPKTVNPQLVFDRLFGGYDSEATQAELDRRKRYRLSVLDYVLQDAKSLKLKLAKTDAAKVEEYLDGVRALEKRLLEAEEEEVCDVISKPRGLGTSKSAST